MHNKKLQCYLIDDDPEELEIFKMALEQLDLELECSYFKSPVLAIAKKKFIAHRIPGYIFLDLNIPAIEIEREIGTLLKKFPYAGTRLNIYSSYFPYAVQAAFVKVEGLYYFQKLPTIDLLSSGLADVFLREEAV